MRSGLHPVSPLNNPILQRRTHFALLILFALAITYPCLRQGLPDGHDRDPHLMYQHFFNEQIDSGEAYPRWMPGLNQGLGGGIFFMQYPLPYYVAWGIGKIIPHNFGIYTETRTQGIGLVLATILAALFAYAWCAEFSDRWSGLAAAVLYVTLPYFLSIDLYMRVAVGEFWAISLLPMTFYFLERMATASRLGLAGLAVAYALLMMSHLFTAVLLAPALLLRAVWRANPSQRVSSVLQTVFALALGCGLAGVYTLPFIGHSRFMHPLNFVPAYGSNFSPLSQMFACDSSLFPTASPGWRFMSATARVIGVAAIALIFMHWYSWRKEDRSFLHRALAVLSVAILLLTTFAGHLPIRGHVAGALPLTDDLTEQRAEIFLCSFLTLEVAMLAYWSLRRTKSRGLADFLIIVGIVSYFFMSSWSQFVWRTFHSLWSIQFPWRFNAFLLPATAGLAALAVSQTRTLPRPRRRVASALFLGVWVIVAAGTATLGSLGAAFSDLTPAAYQPDTDIALPVYAQASDPREALAVEPPDDEKVHVSVVAGSGQAQVLSTHPRRIELQATCETDCALQVGQFYYPAWHARLVPGGTEIPLRPSSPGGLMDVFLPPGEHCVELELPRGWSERAGLWLSIISLGVVIFLATRFRVLDKSRTVRTLAEPTT